MIAVRPARQEDIIQILKERAYFTLRRAFVAEREGKILGVWGLVMYQGRRYVFSEIDTEGFKYPKTILKIARQYLRSLPQGVYYAVVDKRYGTATTFLKCLGFERELDLYRLEIK